MLGNGQGIEEAQEGVKEASITIDCKTAVARLLLNSIILRNQGYYK